MISKTKILQCMKQCAIDPRQEKTEHYVMARDMQPMAHFRRAQELLSFFFEGIRGVDAIGQAMWHLACGLVKYETPKDQG